MLRYTLVQPGQAPDPYYLPLLDFVWGVFVCQLWLFFLFVFFFGTWFEVFCRPLEWWDAVRRSDWPGLCLFCRYQPSCVGSQQNWFGFFFCFINCLILPPPPNRVDSCLGISFLKYCIFTIRCCRINWPGFYCCFQPVYVVNIVALGFFVSYIFQFYSPPLPGTLESLWPLWSLPHPASYQVQRVEAVHRRVLC